MVVAAKAAAKEVREVAKELPAEDLEKTIPR